ncbi:SPOR domain-containing protein [Polaribacter sp.]|nr:SPOR domain-containing protein [Polaribacter sp.]MDC1353941.1 SPOR domain-containing protein [Polaribacter sp.]MDC1400388.1 SPOR domain-containing protein [Polaribacter sp.]
MTVEKYINELLYRYDCVIVPNFGGFITNKIGVKVNSFTHTFHPPTKQITFNTHLKQNDGLVVSYIAAVENISFEKALAKINASVASWNESLKNGAVVFENIGALAFNEKKQLIFEPQKEHNFLTNSFGLSTVSSPAIKHPVPANTSKSVIPLFAKYAATAVVLLSLGFIVRNGYQERQQEQMYASQKEAIDKKIQAATFVISNPLPTISLQVTKESPKSFHVVAGSFQFPENAEKKLKQLKKKGYNATILGLNKWGLTQVAFDSFYSRKEALAILTTIKKEVSKDAWILAKKF